MEASREQEVMMNGRVMELVASDDEEEEEDHNDEVSRR